jgi:hypothetical protein
MSKRKTVALSVTTMLLEELFRLDPSMKIVNARRDRERQGVVVFELDAPNAPDGAVEVAPVYYRVDRPDPIILQSVVWTLRDGSNAVQQIGPPAPVETPEPAVERTAA